ncbi:MAG: pyridoxamine 5'-phosphate oxidase family protein [Actinomycetota bacterium]
MTEGHEGLRKTFRDVSACRIATVGSGGAPHVATRWFVWVEEGLFVATRQDDVTWRNAIAEPRVSVVIDRGREWVDLAGVRLSGPAMPIVMEVPELRAPMTAFHEKYRTFLAEDGFERFAASVPQLVFLQLGLGDIDAWDHRTRP